MKQALTRRDLLAFLRPRTPGLADFLGILELLPAPAVLVDASQAQVVGGNAKALALTAYSRYELQDKRLDELLPTLSSEQLLSQAKQSSPADYPQLKTRHNTTIAVAAQVEPLSPDRRWIIITFEPVTLLQKQHIERQRQANLVLTLQGLALSMERGDLKVITETALQAGQKLTGASALAVYRASELAPSLALFSAITNGFSFPGSIQPTELGRLGSPDLWVPGKRIQSGLHRLARASSLSYLATSLIGDRHNLVGLILAAEPNGIPDPQLPEILQLLANLLSSAFRAHMQQDAQSQQRYQLQEGLLVQEAVQENIQDSVIVLAPDNTILSMNPSAELTLGYASPEVYGQPVENVLIGTAGLSSALRLAAEGISSPDLGNVTLHHRDGRPFPAHILVTPILRAGRLLNTIIILRNQSEHQHIKVRTQQLEQRALLGEVTAIFAHEVRNPINNISMTLQLMEMNETLSPEHRLHIERMKNDCDRLTHLMDSVLSFSRGSDYRMQPIRLEQLIERLLMRWKPRMARINVETNLITPSDLPEIRGNDKALEQVFNNLFSNALRAMQDHGGNLIVKISPVLSDGGQPRIQVDVSDTGIGIPPELLETIFNPFFTTDPHGTGLGLAISQRIITAHKGTIQAHSFAGGGTVFKIQLPILSSTETTAPFIDTQPIR
jgi:PAS domain S-box-containing protein